jgi:LmbE family N-acetylglucosaminyl deacetylase
MIALGPGTIAPSVRHVLCLGAHCDDIEVGCGGTILDLLRRRPAPAVTWIVFTSDARRRAEALASARKILRDVEKKEIVIKSFRDGFLPYTGDAVKRFFEDIKRRVTPDLIFTHHREDRHQDHRLISELTWNTFRDHWILEYEIPKFDGDFGSPNVFVHLDDATCRRKVRTILDTFTSQRGKRWFAEDVFRSVLRLRGLESNAPDAYAEAFYCRKLVLAQGGPSRRVRRTPGRDA